MSRLFGLLLLLSTVFALPLAAEVMDISDGWSFRFQEKSAWYDISLPFSPGREASGGENYLYLKRSLTIPPEIFDGNGAVELYLSKTNGAVEVFVDGALVDYYGSGGDDFFYHDAFPKKAVLPLALFGEDRTAELEVRVFTESGVFVVPEAKIGSLHEFDGLMFILEFFGSDIYLVFSILSLFIAFFFFQQFVFQRKETTNLVFALANFALFLYFFNMGFSFRLIDPVWMDKIAKSALFLFFSLLALFFVMFFDVHNKKSVRTVLISLGVLMALPFYVFPKDIAASRALFNMLILPGEALLLFIAYISVRSIIQKRPYAGYIAVGVFFGFLFGSYDIYHAAAGLEPAVWLQGIGIFLFDLSMFFALAVRNMRVHEELRHFSEELAVQRERLQASFQRVGETGRIVSETSRELDTVIKAATSRVQVLTRESDVIAESMQGQHELVNRTDESVERFLAGIGETNSRLEKQNRDIGETAATIEEMLENLDAVAVEVRDTADFTGRLDGLTRSGSDAMQTSEHAMNKIREVSEDIYQIIEAVNDLAARTNLLAMNAAIEAAHAGDKGRGFAVVASEIKKLAEGSALKTTEIGKQVASIIERIEEGVTANETVRTLLDSIRSDTAEAVKKVQRVAESVQEQRTASAVIQQSLISLAEVSGAIGNQAGEQGLAGREMKAALEELVGTSLSVVKSTENMNRESRAILDQMETINGCSVNSFEAVDRLKRMIES